MKFSLALGKPRPLTRSEARGCFTANLALPGSGSLVAGRAVGYFQMALTLIGFLISIVAGVNMVRWYLANSSQMSLSTEDDPFGSLAALWHVAEWPLFGIGIFVFALSWGIVTSMQIMKDSPKDPVPPVIR